ncbi:phosphonate ABC transporter ATP-binding protein [Ktedonosporobacter rubrisoli]|uniref:Phosphonate ABC transporter ATP-binding protein n=1 Tax=Ktedonosporobacter rubrisoli TaxID=2509675 RepID=A0A4P6JM63_KTERU|nr:phosphonate ABC transporter ATP-binding protein [Ktedonosporobacter rubrisoli]QBD76377.1 phosphonate ABC transporter ATP-binding protein [Ktedonosporobacter rubrisoli]
MSNQTSLEVSGVSKIYPNGYEALADVSFNMQQGEFICIIGRSGAGKSTLLRCINGLHPVTRGSIRIQGTEITSLPDEEKLAIRRRIGFIFQEFNLVGRLSVMHNVLSGRLGYMNGFHSVIGYFSQEHRQKALECLGRVHMLHRATYRADNISGGEKQRVAIARALAQEPLLLLADEPVASLDPDLTWGIMEDLRSVAREEHVPTLVNIHDLETAKAFADRIIGIARGRILYDGPPSGLTTELLREIYRSDDPNRRSRYELVS